MKITMVILCAILLGAGSVGKAYAARLIQIEGIVTSVDLYSGVSDPGLIDFLVTLEDSTNTEIPSPEGGNFLVDPPDLDSFSSNGFELSFCAGSCPVDGINVVGTITSISPIPIPTSILLLGSGLIGLIGFRGRFKKISSSSII